MTVDKLEALAAQGRKLIPRPQNRSGEWFSINNAKADRAEVFIYGAIGDDFMPEDVTAASFVSELREISAKNIDLHINSPGGLVFDGVTIYSALRNHDANVDVFIDGIAASAASFIAMAGDTIAIEKPAKMMIHDAGGLVLGNAADMREMADVLDGLSDTIAEIYYDRAGGTVEEWRDAMRAESWFSSSQAVDAGLADQVVGAESTNTTNTSSKSQLIRARARVQVPRRNI